ncbi:response regulator [Luteimonas sp. MC1750]|uniref:response regulator n=1 Tax=Luteimonas sp. MC1750 TaxID=2799326 RepID=UPI0018F05E0A|nr:response regulator [Luteimonas sp. MC1750]MBJ6983734.1 response regulator [Luteimonas sp. MC1750]QQO06569.1 response regulator [Luteimonas sp. MC1750]
MSGSPLAQRRILVVEDEALLAELLCEELAAVGALVVGPAGTVQHALEMIAAEARLDAAILDVNLAGDSSEPVAVQLAALDVPVLLTTGYDAAALPPALVHLPRWRKPSTFEALVEKLARLLGSA